MTPSERQRLQIFEQRLKWAQRRAQDFDTRLLTVGQATSNAQFEYYRQQQGQSSGFTYTATVLNTGSLTPRSGQTVYWWSFDDFPLSGGGPSPLTDTGSAIATSVTNASGLATYESAELGLWAGIIDNDGETEAVVYNSPDCTMIYTP